MDSYSYGLAQPPRAVPASVRTRVLLGGTFSLFGWIFFGFGMIFVWIFGAMADFGPVTFALSSTQTTTATISDVQQTSASQNDTPIYANSYTFRVENAERDVRGVGYTTGPQFSVGQTVPVEYVPGNPERSRIEGARSGQFSGWVICITGIFPLIGLIFIVVSLYRGWHDTQLLQNGRIAEGTLAAKEATNTRVNGRTVYKLTFDFTTDLGEHRQAVAKSNQPQKMEDDTREQLLYHPNNPKQTALVDNLPGAPRINEFGEIQPAGTAGSIAVFIAPLLAILLNAVACSVMFLLQ